MFANARGFNSSLNNWNTAAVRDMSCLFCGASSFNRPLHLELEDEITPNRG